jgi:hypothetical protein
MGRWFRILSRVRGIYQRGVLDWPAVPQVTWQGHAWNILWELLSSSVLYVYVQTMPKLYSTADRIRSAGPPCINSKEQTRRNGVQPLLISYLYVDRDGIKYGKRRCRCRHLLYLQSIVLFYFSFIYESSWQRARRGVTTFFERRRAWEHQRSL